MGYTDPGELAGRVRPARHYVTRLVRPTVFDTRIRAEMEALLTIPGLDIPVDAVAPCLNFLTAKIVSEVRAPA